MLRRISPPYAWHRWFAWRPVIVDCNDGTDAWAWLCWVEWRADTAPCVIYDYRLPLKE